MLTEVSVLPPEVSENLGLSGLLLVSATVSVLEGLDGLPKLSWLWTVIGPAAGLEVAVKLKAEVVKTSLLATAELTVSVWVTGGLNAPLPAAVVVGVAALLSAEKKVMLLALLGLPTEVNALPPEVG